MGKIGATGIGAPRTGRSLVPISASSVGSPYGAAFRNTAGARSTPPRRSVLFVNPRSGGGRGDARGGGRAGARTRDRRHRPRYTPELGELVRGAVAEGADALGVAGGDGSLAVVAAAARVHGLAFVCVPAGTRNHFALDLGVDRHDLVGALDAFTDGVERSIDVGEVNGRVFLNNVSLGIYGDAVRQPAYRDAKVRTLVETAAEVLGTSGAVPELHLVDDLGNEHRRPAVVLVSNNSLRARSPDRAGDPAEARHRRARHCRALTHHAPARSSRTGLESDAARGGRGSTGARRHRRRGGRASGATRVRHPARALRVRISSRHPGVSPSGRLP